VDWHKSLKGIECSNPRSESYSLAAGQTLHVFDGKRSLSLDGTTEFSLLSSPLQVGHYRIAATAGTLPEFRTDRNVDLTGRTCAIEVRPDGTAIFDTGEPDFASVVVGDHVFIPGMATGDPVSPFNVINQGFWEVLGKPSATSLQLVRLQRDITAMYSESVSVTNLGQFIVYSAEGVQVGDRVELSAGFSAPNLKTYKVREVTPTWIGISSPVPLPDESDVAPGADGLSVYAFAKRYLRVEADQECAVLVNGDTGEKQRISPWRPGDLSLAGEYTRTGPTWSLSLVNKSATSATVCIISVE
jgi:hypothetical protein